MKSFQKWSFTDDKKLINFMEPTKALSIVEDTCCNLTLVPISLGHNFHYSDGRIFDESTGTSLFADENGFVNLSPPSHVKKRQIGGIDWFWTREPAAPVNCPELDWPINFEEFENHGDDVPECWENVEPTFRLFLRNATNGRDEADPCVLADQPAHLTQMQGCQAIQDQGGITHLVIIIHGFWSGAPWPADEDEWPGHMAVEVLAADTTQQLGVITVDWEEGAGGSYGPAAANTRYVGIATERIVKQLGGAAMSVHCIGHSLGAHTCGFLSNAMETDYGEKLDRLTGMDPAGPRFTTDGWCKFLICRTHETRSKFEVKLHPELF